MDMKHPKIIVAGIGPGNESDMTPAVISALQESDVVVGYKYYFQFVIPYLHPSTACIDTGMKRERARAEQAFELAEQGKTVCVISSGDAGIYGMTPLVYEMKRERNSDVEIVSLPGITLWQNHKEDCIDVLDSVCRTLRDGDFAGSASAAQEADAPLWFFWTLQRLEAQIGAKKIWKHYGEAMKQVLESYKRGVAGRVVLNDNGLVWASSDEVPLTWMNSVIDGRSVTPRNGYQVEVNALWYNAVRYALRLAGEAGDTKFVKAWEKLPERTAASFNELFRLPKGYLADCVGCDGANTDIRPNMIVACGLPYKMLDEQTQLEVIRTVRQHLLTPKGLRSLSPRNPLYKGSQEDTPAERDFAGKNGSVWPWLLSFYVSACFDIDGDAFLPQAEEILAGFEEDIQTYGIGSIGELFDADPPFAPRGAISQAWSVAAVLDIYGMILARKPKETPGKSEKPTKKANPKTAKAAKNVGKEKVAAKAAKAVKPAAKAAAKRTAAKKTTKKKTTEKTK